MTPRAWAIAAAGMLLGATALGLALRAPVPSSVAAAPAPWQRADSPFAAPPHDSAAAATATDAPASAPGDTLLQPTLRYTLEELLAEAGDVPDPRTLKARLAALVAARFAAADAARALALAERYVDYRVALSSLSTPSAAGDAEALQTAWQARRAVRQRFFNDAEYAALFGQTDALDEATLARLRLAHDPRLDEAERSAAMRAAEATLPAAWQAERAAALAPLEAAAQTAVFDAEGTDRHARHAARAARYGNEAALALAQLDAQRSDWHQRLDAYRAAREAGLDAAALAALRAQQFSPTEQLRLEGALALRALQGPPVPARQN